MCVRVYVRGRVRAWACVGLCVRGRVSGRGRVRAWACACVLACVRACVYVCYVYMYTVQNTNFPDRN